MSDRETPTTRDMDAFDEPHSEGLMPWDQRRWIPFDWR